jgi:two-component system sensor histidine kinase PilS (NtrC family)
LISSHANISALLSGKVRVLASLFAGNACYTKPTIKTTIQRQATPNVNRPAILTQPATYAPSQHNLALFRIYVAYRSLLALVLLIMLISPNTRLLVGVNNPTMYMGVALAYLATSVPLVGSLSARLSQKLLFLVFLVDIAAIILLADSSGGMASGLPILLVITVAASAVLIINRTLATLIAALSVLAILLDTVWLILNGTLNANALFPSGLLGLLIFGVSMMVQAIAHRLGRAEELARNRASDLYTLQRLNEQIVQHMETGILLVNSEGVVRVMNKSATKLLAPDRPITVEHGRQLADYCAELAYQFEQWKGTGQHRAKPFTVLDSAPPVIAHFRELQPNSHREALVFVEDYSPITQYAQSLKLTSLGRLTASIAHEIRNPRTVHCRPPHGRYHPESLQTGEPDCRERDADIAPRTPKTRIPDAGRLAERFRQWLPQGTQSSGGSHYRLRIQGVIGRIRPGKPAAHNDQPAGQRPAPQ